MKHFPSALALVALICALTASPLCAQVGNNNPAGASGIFNGQVGAGCGYDPYTGNATRSITDIAVAGAVGEYPLALVRTANSRTPSTNWRIRLAGRLEPQLQLDHGRLAGHPHTKFFFRKNTR